MNYTNVRMLYISGEEQRRHLPTKRPLNPPLVHNVVAFYL